MEVLSRSKPKARKEHKCDFCYGKIQKGEVYDNQVCKHDYLYTWKSHFRCGNIASKLGMHDDCDEGVTGEDFHEFIINEYLRLLNDENVKIPPFSEQLDFVCNYYNLRK